MLTCKEHRTYKGIRQPRANCACCWTIWNAARLNRMEGRRRRARARLEREIAALEAHGWRP